MQNRGERDRDRLRTELLCRRSGLARETRHRLSERIGRLVREDEQFQKARYVMLYVAVRGEVETRDLIEDCLQKGKRVERTLFSDKKKSYLKLL